MHGRFARGWALGALATLMACGGGGGGGDDPSAKGGSDAAPMLEDVGRGGGDGQGGGAGQGGAGQGGGGEGGAGQGSGGAGQGGEGGGAGQGGAGGASVMPVEDCPATCARYAACDRLDRVGGDEGACLDLCEAISTQRQSAWFGCVSRNTCDSLGSCAVPSAPAPDCAAVCARATACGAELAGCADLCAAPDSAAAVEACGAALPAANCSAEDFGTCVLARVAPDCTARCEAQAPCAGGSVAACAQSCLAELAAGDPLSRARLAEEVDCYAARGTDDCQVVVACAQGAARFLDPPPRDDFCQRWSACGWDFDLECLSAYDALVGYGDHYGTLYCFENFLNGCVDLFTAYDTCLNGPQPDPRCAGFCQGVQACGVEFGEGAGCNAACLGDTGRLSPQVDCLAEGTCDALAQCVADNGPQVRCEARCGSQDTCGAAGAGPDCVAECVRTAGQARFDLLTACIVDAGDDCAAVAACRLPGPVACDLYCQRFTDCGYAVGPDCVSGCENVAYANPENTIPIIDCVAASPVCDDWEGTGPAVTACQEEPWRGQACSAFCRQGEVCAAGDLGGTNDCLTACGQGLIGEDAARLDFGRDCLAQAPIYPTCADIDACIPASLDVDCDALCTRAADCGVELIDCGANCAGDPLGRARAFEGERCLAEAAGCEQVARCLAPQAAPPPAAIDQNTFCELWNACGYDFQWEPCDFAYRDLAFTPGAQACMADRMRVGCFDPFGDYTLCIEAGGPSPCDAYCAAQVTCHPEGVDRGTCLNTCRSPQSADDAVRQAPVLACGPAFSCADFDACVAENGVEGQCHAFCDARGACGGVDDAAACFDACVADFPRVRASGWRTCVAAAGADCAAVAACTPPEPPPCRDACARSVACGFDSDLDRCANTCDDAAAADPIAGTLQVGCLLAAQACEGAANSVAACLSDPGAGSALCAAWCRLVDDCDPASARSLEACVLACALGLEPAEALALNAASACLLEQGPDATCRALRPCRVEPPAPDCDALCARAAACGVEAPDCPANCAAEPTALAGCLAESDRLNRRCGGVATCLGYEAPPAPPACSAYCGALSGCDAAQDRFLCERDCAAAEDPAVYLVRATCLNAAGCRAVADCSALDATPSPVCAAPCRTAQACDAFADQAECQSVCTGFIRSRAVPQDYIPRVNRCLADADAANACDAATARECFEQSQGDCASFCEEQITCNWWYVQGQEDLCLNDCESTLDGDPAFAELMLQCSRQWLAGVCNVDEFSICTQGF